MKCNIDGQTMALSIQVMKCDIIEQTKTLSAEDMNCEENDIIH